MRNSTKTPCHADSEQKVTHPQTLPSTGFIRLPQVLAMYPVSKSTWWLGIKTGRFPAGVKLSDKCTAWRVEDIRSLIERLAVTSEV